VSETNLKTGKLWKAYKDFQWNFTSWMRKVDSLAVSTRHTRIYIHAAPQKKE
jgi:hypothetical protein